MAFSSPFDIAERSADYWKRQLTLEETVNLSCWISLLNRYSFCLCAFAITLILLGKGWVYRSEWQWDRRSLFVEHPQQHILKLRKHIIRYVFRIQFFTALQISVAETQKYFSISNPTHSLWTVSRLVNCCNSWKNTTGLDLFPTAIVPWHWSEAMKFLNFVSELWPQRLRHWYFILLKHIFFPFEACADSLSPAKTSSDISRIMKIDSTHVEKKQLKFHVVVELFLFLRNFHFCSYIPTVAKLGLASRWCSNVRPRATSFLHSLGVSKSE